LAVLISKNRRCIIKEITQIKLYTFNATLDVDFFDRSFGYWLIDLSNMYILWMLVDYL
jgi:hypothetical protein